MAFIAGLFLHAVYLVLRLWVHMHLCKATGTLVVPHWPSAPFWPKIAYGGQFYRKVIDWRYPQRGTEAYTPCLFSKGMFGKIDLPFNRLALNMDFN